MKKLISFWLILSCLVALLPSAVGAETDPVLSNLVKIQAREDFAFRYDLKNSGVGEASPITNDYYLSKYKVTNAQYKEFLDATGHKAPTYWKNGTYPAGKADHPVLNVSYSSAVAYCSWISDQYEDWNFRLPTEAEWENAAMGTYYGNTSVKYPTNVSPSYNATTHTITTDFNFNGVIAAKLFKEYGSDHVVNYIKGDYAGDSETLGECIQISKTGGVTNWANHGGSATKGYFLQTDLYTTISAEGGHTTPVGSYPANTLGLYDMAGNCWDLTSSVVVASNGLEAGVSCYAVRGGSWYATARSCTFYYRGEGRKDSPSSTVGFRLAADFVGSQESGSVKNADTGKVYDSWAAAVADLDQAGGTLQLLQDLSGSAITVRRGVTLDLNGKHIQSKYFTCYGSVIDGDRGGEGSVKVEKKIHIAGQDGYLPIYDTQVGAYRFYHCQVQNLGGKEVNSNTVKFGFRPTFENPAAYQVLAETTDTDLDVLAYLQWGSLPAPLSYQFSEATLRDFAQRMAAGNSGIAIVLTVTGTEQLSTGSEIQTEYALASVPGVTACSESASWMIR